jgi:HKD family nuclease
MSGALLQSKSQYTIEMKWGDIMAVLNFLLQGLDENNDHFSSIQWLFTLPDINRGLVASAFLNASGASMIAETLSPISDRVSVFIGIRNGVTTIQGLQVLKDNNIYPYLVDTATQTFIFYPKVYLFSNADTARLVIGSANITPGGFVKNIEASAVMELNLAEEGDIQLVDNITNSFQQLIDRYPENVFRLTDAMDLAAMVTQGLLEDERSAVCRAIARATRTERTEARARMRLRTRTIPRIRRTGAEATVTVDIPGTTAQMLAIGNSQLLWRSSKLTRRDLNIPTGANTNRTGSMLLKKGDSSQEIDPRSYFRYTLFENQEWTRDPRPDRAHLERCNVPFRIIIKD